MQTRTIAMIGASVGVAAVAATGVTYASAAPESAPYTREAVAATVPLGGDSEKEKDYDHKKEKDHGDKKEKGYGDKKDHGQIQINERTYSADPGACIAVVNTDFIFGNEPLSFNIRNTSKRTVEFFNGYTCNTGAPVATVGPRSSSTAIMTAPNFGPPVGSFRVIDDHH